MLRELCNQLCIRMSKYSHKALGKVAEWAAKGAGLKVVAADATLLPEGFLMFDGKLAQEVGLERAVIHQKLKGWQEYNCRKGKRSHFRQDRWWTYGSPKYWLDNEFIWSSLSTVRRAIDDLEQAGLLLVDRIDGHLWLSALSGEHFNLNAGAIAVQQNLFNLDSGASNCAPSIDKQTTLKQPKRKKQTPISPRKAAVADFPMPEIQDQAVREMRESREGAVEGRDVLHELPGALVTAWTDSKMLLEELVARHGVDRINAEWPTVQGFKNPVAGLRTKLAKKPTPISATPPSSADDPTEPDWTDDDTPALDTTDVEHFKRMKALMPAEMFAAYCKTNGFDDKAVVA